MKKRRLLVVGLLLAACTLIWLGCSGRGVLNPTKGISQSSIDWVDFVKLSKGHYTGVFNAVIADPALVTDDMVGEVKFKVADVVTNPSYRIQVGDAAYLAKGTKLYRIEGFAADELIAAADEHSINGYRIYREDKAAENYRRNFKEIAKHPIEKIEWYSSSDHKLLAALDAEESKQLIALLQAGTVEDNYRSPSREREPVYYEIVMYFAEPLAYSFTIMDDGGQIVFYDDDHMKLIDADIAQWMP